MMKRANLVQLTLAGLVLGAGSLQAADKATEKTPAAQSQEIPAVTVSEVTELDRTEPKRYVGVIRAIEEVSIPARISGWIEKINFTEGSMVKKGDLLFELEDTTYQANVLSAKAILAQAEAEFDYAQSEFDRKSGLYEKNAVAKTEQENASRLVKSTKAKIEEAKAALIQAENELSYTKIYAPITGRIGKRTYSEGNYVTPQSAELADIVQIDPIHVSFSISERDFLDSFNKAQASTTESVITIVPANHEEFKGDIKIDFIDNRVDKATGTITIYLECTNPDERLVPGGFVTVKLADKFAEPVPAINVTAVMTDQKSNYVYVVDADNIVERRDIKLGNVVEGMQLVTSGLKVGEQVVIDGVHKAAPGSKVNPVPVAQPTQQ
ncbi:efflux RND transporter periplasmic adaptor subunit [Victivallis sp. Marseille-Q1083]|uniref:efflux RND transporter periplasmic adaptor subunit n=1 Tax=Victivallis sp. Marseille-Q1083 TaxID=2717288 RepID=UPI00158DBF4B|nr:efflux RND transporter periplasmic adaptor subunit [Victivallis sp. Marseille-Q1083]